MTITVRTISAAYSHIGKPVPLDQLPKRERPAQPRTLTNLDREWFDFSRIAGHRVA